jgi:hypothetical protein
LKDSSIKKRVSEIAEKLANQGYEIATDVPGLMKMPITDCSFSPNQILVTINLPLKLSGISYSVLEVIQVPFQFRKQQCSLMDPAEYIIRIGPDVVPISKSMVKGCRINQNSLCFVPQNDLEVSSFSDCARSMIGGVDSDIKRVSYTFIFTRLLLDCVLFRCLL